MSPESGSCRARPLSKTVDELLQSGHAFWRESVADSRPVDFPFDESGLFENTEVLRHSRLGEG
jgi:hypothetical protein